MKKVILCLAVFMSLASVAYAGVLMSSWMEGTKTYCKYSDGSIITLNGSATCPSYN